MRRLKYPSLRQGAVLELCPSIDNSRSTLVTDFSPYRNHGTLTNMDPASDWVVSGGRSSLDFDGTNDMVQTGSMNLSTNSYTATGWARFRATGNFNAIVGQSSGVAGDLLENSSGSLTYQWEGTADEYWAVSGLVITLNVWHFCAVTISPTAANIYLGTNGAVKVFTNTKTHNSKSLGVMQIGRERSIHEFNGQLDDIRIYNRALTPSEIGILATRPGIAFETYSVPIVRGAGGGPTYTMTAEVGAFTLTGSNTGLVASRQLAATVGEFALTGNNTGLNANRLITAETVAFSLTGNNTGLTASRVLTASTGTFALTGTDTGLTASRLITAGTGSFALTGNDAELVYTPTGGPTYTLTAETAAFSLTGSNTGLLAARNLTAETVSFTLTGNNTGLNASRLLTAETGSFALTGIDTGLLASRLLTAATGSFVVTGNSVSFVYSGATSARLRITFCGESVTTGDLHVTETSGNLIVNETTGDLVVTRTSNCGPVRLLAETGVFAFTGNAANLLVSRRIDATTGSFVLTGSNVDLSFSLLLESGDAFLLESGELLLLE